jgi:hypothetical protein
MAELGADAVVQSIPGDAIGERVNLCPLLDDGRTQRGCLQYTTPFVCFVFCVLCFCDWILLHFMLFS